MSPAWVHSRPDQRESTQQPSTLCLGQVPDQPEQCGVGSALQSAQHRASQPAKRGCENTHELCAHNPAIAGTPHDINQFTLHLATCCSAITPAIAMSTCASPDRRQRPSAIRNERHQSPQNRAHDDRRHFVVLHVHPYEDQRLQPQHACCQHRQLRMPAQR